MEQKNIMYWKMPYAKRQRAYEDVTFILFSDFGDRGDKILTSNVLDPAVKTGDSFWALSGLPPRRVKRMKERVLEASAVWMVSDLGIGVLFNHYLSYMGCYVYLHIHEDPRLILSCLEWNNGVFREDPVSPCPFDVPKEFVLWDDDVLRRGRDRLCSVEAVRQMFCGVQNFVRYSGAQMYESVAQINEMLGEPMTFCDTRAAFSFDAFGFDNHVSHFGYIFWLCMLASLSADGQVKGSFHPFSEMDSAPLCLRMEIKLPPMDQLRQRSDLRHIKQVTEEVKKALETYEIYIEDQWDFQGEVLTVDLACIHAPESALPNDGKEDPLPRNIEWLLG